MHCIYITRNNCGNIKNHSKPDLTINLTVLLQLSLYYKECNMSPPVAAEFCSSKRHSKPNTDSTRTSDATSFNA